jgi:two-component system, chemotaxis family, chemotaxis protein CheY
MATEPTRRYRLLAVEDDSDSAALIVRVALKCGYEAFPIADARSLRETISRWRPDVITLDLCLPDVDGLEVLSSLNSVEFGGRLIIISGQPDWFRNQATRLAFAQGLRVTAQMSKPIHLEQLRELLTTIKASLLLSMNHLASGADAVQTGSTETDQQH